LVRSEVPEPLASLRSSPWLLLPLLLKGCVREEVGCKLLGGVL
jgi:hypothetical protein